MVRRRSSRTRRTPKKKKTVLRTAKTRGAVLARSAGLSIEDDRLVGAGVSFVETPNRGGDHPQVFYEKELLHVLPESHCRRVRSRFMALRDILNVSCP